MEAQAEAQTDVKPPLAAVPPPPSKEEVAEKARERVEEERRLFPKMNRDTAQSSVRTFFARVPVSVADNEKMERWQSARVDSFFHRAFGGQTAVRSQGPASNAVETVAKAFSDFTWD